MALEKVLLPPIWVSILYIKRLIHRKIEETILLRGEENLLGPWRIRQNGSEYQNKHIAEFLSHLRRVDPGLEQQIETQISKILSDD